MQHFRYPSFIANQVFMNRDCGFNNKNLGKGLSHNVILISSKPDEIRVC
jgi:hypothetical protein